MLPDANELVPLLSPGDYLQPGESDLAGLQSRLQLRLGTDKHSSSEAITNKAVDDGEAAFPPVASEAEVVAQQAELKKWDVGELLAQWWRPNFEGGNDPPLSARPGQQELTQPALHLLGFMYPYIPGSVCWRLEGEDDWLVS